MKKEKRIMNVIGQVDEKYIEEAAPKKEAKKKLIGFKWTKIAACACLLLALPLTAFAVDIIQYNAAVNYLNSLGIPVEDLSDYSRKEIKEAVKTIDAGESSPLTKEILDLVPDSKEPIKTPTQVTSEQISELTPTMTRKEVLSLLGDTQDVGSGIYMYVYEVDQQYLLQIPFAGDEAQLGVTGEDLLKAVTPISGDVAPMVYVNDTLYQIVSNQPDLADERNRFILLGEIESKVNSSQEPNKNFQANDDIVGSKVYQYESDIVVLINGKYCLYKNQTNAESGIITFEGKRFNKADLSQETLEWIKWYNSLSPEEQLAVSSIPPDLNTYDGSETSDADTNSSN